MLTVEDRMHSVIRQIERLEYLQTTCDTIQEYAAIQAKIDKLFHDNNLICKGYAIVEKNAQWKDAQ